MSDRPIIHCLQMGESGAGKDTFAATFPKPMLVWHLDGFGQEMPYLNNVHFGKAQSQGEVLSYDLGQAKVPYRDIVAGDGGFIRIEYFSSDNPTYPSAAAILESRMSYFYDEQSNWKTLVCGSLSSAALESRLNEQFVLNPQYKDPRKWYGAATEYVERLILMQKALSCNVVFICHINRTQDDVGGELMFGPDLPGRLSYSAGRYFNETYRIFVGTDQNGVRHRYLQTDSDGRYQCKTHINAPNPAFPSYEGLWAGWDA